MPIPQILMTIKGLMLLAGAVYGFAALLRKEDAAWVKRKPLALFLSMLLIGMWGHNIWVAYLALTLAPVLAAKDRAEAAALYCVLIVALPLLSRSIVFGGLYIFHGDKYLFCALGLAIAFFKGPKGPALMGSRFDLPLLIIVALELVHARSFGFTATLRQFAPVLLTILLPYLLLSRSLNTREDVRRFVLALSLTGFVMAAVAIVEVRLHWLIYAQIEGALHVERSVNLYTKMRAGMIRAPASFGDSTSLGMYLAMTSLAMFALRSAFASPRKMYVALGIVALGILAANTRGAIIGAAIGFLVQDLYNRRYGALSVKVMGAAGIYLFALTAAQFSPFFAAMLGKTSDTQGTADYRILLFRRGMEEIRKHPLVGTTLQAAMDNLQDLRQGEGIIDLVNGYISYGLTLGYLGIVGLVSVFVSLCAAMLVARRKLQVDPELVKIGAFVFSIAFSSIINSFYGGFGGTASTPFYEVCAVGAVLWAMRGRVPIGGKVDGTPRSAPVSGLAALIAADRARAKAANAAA